MQLNDLMNQLHLSQNNPQAAQAIQKLQSVMQSPSGQNLAKQISPDTANRIEQVAKAAQKGDKQAAQAALQQLLSTQEGATLAAQLRSLLG